MLTPWRLLYILECAILAFTHCLSLTTASAHTTHTLAKHKHVERGLRVVSLIRPVRRVVCRSGALQGGRRVASDARNVCTLFRQGRHANKHEIKAKGKRKHKHKAKEQRWRETKEKQIQKFTGGETMHKLNTLSN